MTRPGCRRPRVRNGTDPQGRSARGRLRTCRPSAAERL